MTPDRVGAALLPTTDDFIATLMGTDRSTVRLASSLMQNNGIIDLRARCGEDCEPQEARKIGLRVLRRYSTVRR
jgi:hypothetical protein